MTTQNNFNADNIDPDTRDRDGLLGDQLAGSTVGGGADSAEADRIASYDGTRDGAGDLDQTGRAGVTGDPSVRTGDDLYRGDTADTSDARYAVRDGQYDENVRTVSDDGTTARGGYVGDGTGTPTGAGEPGLVHDLDDPEMPNVITIDEVERAAANNDANNTGNVTNRVNADGTYNANSTGNLGGQSSDRTGTGTPAGTTQYDGQQQTGFSGDGVTDLRTDQGAGTGQVQGNVSDGDLVEGRTVDATGNRLDDRAVTALGDQTAGLGTQPGDSSDLR